METGWLQWSFHQFQGWVKKTTSQVFKRRRSQGYEQTQAEDDREHAEDEDVREERQTLQAGWQNCKAAFPRLLASWFACFALSAFVLESLPKL